MAKKLNYDFIKCAAMMPPLTHNTRNGEYDIAKSDAAKWIAAQPEVLQKIFDIARPHGMIQYDAELKAWKGVNYD